MIPSLCFYFLCSLKEQEQVVCKFYNELGRILVKDFHSVSQLDEAAGQTEESELPVYSHHKIGKHKESISHPTQIGF